MEETIEGYIEHIIYRNQENGYTVANLVAEETCLLYTSDAADEVQLV